MKRNLIIGLTVGVALVLAVTVWPTRYRYETKVRCTFNFGEPSENSDWGGDASKRYKRFVDSTFKDEFYRVDRITGEIFIAGQHPGQEGWKLIGLAYDKPEEFLVLTKEERKKANESRKRLLDYLKERKQDPTITEKQKEMLDATIKKFSDMSEEEVFRWEGKAKTGCAKYYSDKTGGVSLWKTQYSYSDDPNGYWRTKEEMDLFAKPSPTATKKPE